MILLFRGPHWKNRKGLTGLVQWKLNLAGTDLAENLDLKDTPQKVWATILDFYYISPLEIAEHLVLADKSLVTDFSAKSSTYFSFRQSKTRVGKTLSF